MKKIISKFTFQQIKSARKYWEGLTKQDLIFYWKHYTTGQGKGMYSVKPETNFFDYLVISAMQTEYEKINDI